MTFSTALLVTIVYRCCLARHCQIANATRVFSDGSQRLDQPRYLRSKAIIAEGTHRVKKQRRLLDEISAKRFHEGSKFTVHKIGEQDEEASETISDT
jgi:hypothetical protein